MAAKLAKEQADLEVKAAEKHKMEHEMAAQLAKEQADLEAIKAAEKQKMEEEMATKLAEEQAAETKRMEMEAAEANKDKSEKGSATSTAASTNAGKRHVNPAETALGKRLKHASKTTPAMPP